MHDKFTTGLETDTDHTYMQHINNNIVNKCCTARQMLNQKRREKRENILTDISINMDSVATILLSLFW